MAVRIALLVFSWFSLACSSASQKLPILGNPLISGSDTSYPVIHDFKLTNQHGHTVNMQTFLGKIYVADFIFLSCPSICPKMTGEMFKTYKAYADDDRVVFISYTIDPERDSVPKLKAYADNLGVSAPKWQFLTGPKDTILQLANGSYFSTAYPDSTAPGGFTHSGGLLLVDKQRHIRGLYNGTKPEETARLIKDIQTLLQE